MEPAERLAAAVSEAALELSEEPRPLSAEELAAYRDAGYVVLRGLVPECLADVLREQVIHPGLKMERSFDVSDPTTWGKGGLARQALSVYEKLVTLLGSESPYYGARMNFGRALQRECRGDLTEAELDLIERAWSLANQVASRRLRVVLDQLVGHGAYGFDAGEEVLKRSLHARFALPVKDPRPYRRLFRRPLFGWHVDGAWHVHFLGKQVESRGARQVKPALACVMMLAWNRTLPRGGMTGVIPGSHKGVMQALISARKWGGISNLWLLLRQSLFGESPSDPVADAPGGVMRAGDLLVMHPYLVHSSAWNHQDTVRLGGHLFYKYHHPMDDDQLLEFCRRQVGSTRKGEPLPANTELLLHSLEPLGSSYSSSSSPA
jgi:hypothetical protein